MTESGKCSLFFSCKKLLIYPNAEFTLHDFQSNRITAVFTLHDYLVYRPVAAVFTLHDGSATGGFTLHDFTIGRIANKSLLRKLQPNAREKWQDHADIMIY